MSNASLVLVIAAAIFGCTGGTPMSSAPDKGAAEPAMRAAPARTSEFVELRYDETVDYLDLRLSWLTLADSRCPIGVTCVWAGQMLATVEITHSTDGTIEIELLRRAGREPQVAHAFDYELRLLDVSPHPKNGIKPDRGNYVMRVEIGKP